MGDRSTQNSQFVSINYRNGIYQGKFNRSFDCRQGTGLIFTTDNHMVMGSGWHEDLANGNTFIFYNHSHYVYGFWSNNIPHGFNAIRMDNIVFMAFYDMGVIVGRVLVLYEQYSLAVVLDKSQNQNVFSEVQKGDIFSDQDFNSYIAVCGWPQFQQNWKTLIKFLSANFICDNQPKNQKLKLRLINQSFYRFGYDQGIAIVFDDEYKVISAGIHRKAKLKSLGVRFTKQNFIQQGNFDKQNEVYAFNFDRRPDNKLGKIYSNHLLKSLQFVNKYLSNPAKILINYLQDLVVSNFFRKLISGQITLRRLDASYGSPDAYPKIDSRVQSNRQQNQNQQVLKIRQSQAQRLKQQKERLQLYKKQLYQSISKRSRVINLQQNNSHIKQLTPQKIQQVRPETPSKNIITKPPVEIATRSNRRREADQTRTKSRSPIFTPQKDFNRSPSASNVSPFKQKIKSKIFKEGKSNKQKRYTYEPIQSQLYPRLSEMMQYSSPHQELQFSKSRNNQIGEQVIPVTVQNQRVSTKKQEQKIKQSLKEAINKQMIKKKQKQMIEQQNRRRKSKELKQKRTKNSNGQLNPTFRGNTYLMKDQKQYLNTNVPNIIISTPNRSKSPYRHKKVIRIQQDTNEVENVNHRKNDVYLNRAVTEVSPQQKGRKIIRGSTYLEKYSIQKNNKSPTRKQKMAEQGTLQNNKYSRTIKIYNQNNKVYERVSSPPSKYQESFGPRRQRNNEPKYQRYESRMSPQRRSIKALPNQEIDSKRRYAQESTPVRRKYQYIYE